ncbi:hypothetical protein [Segetibacter aerophilus]|uniref:Uncharacterized protein n=1 Tax=Segetibacter aerophilus TaxID=670293 RepID=A0A512B6W2_9BACT|nr:hypothetical protein [Segetibacter aerophilus]GEO07700.1 hypothetical protein SAE01_01960 [Segetibacter aerophilus]
MTSLYAYFRNSFLLVAFFLLTSLCLTASAQNTTPQSRIAVVANETKTNIWISDFPKKTSIVIFDNDDNLLSIVSTNDFGAAYVSLPTSIKTTVIVKTLDGEVKASNQPVIKKQEEQTAVSATNKDASKA